ncbi:hypothetical protein ABZ914_34480, partial [Spirillospora sp. NPDC046719]
MGQPGMRITVTAAMRARDVSRPWPDGAEASPPGADPGEAPRAEPARRSRAAKNERGGGGARGRAGEG